MSPYPMKPKKPKMTPKQKKLLKVTMLDPDATLEDRGRQAGYSGRKQAWRAMKSPAVLNALEQCREIMKEREKLSLGALLNKVEEGLEATSIKSLKVEGTKFAVESEVKDFGVRHKYLETALELHGAKESALSPSVSLGPLNIAIVLNGNGSDAEKDALSDALLGARIARGLHPLENRRLTEEELEAYRKMS